MSIAGGQSVPGHQRAETYLRLQVEAELRTALGFPRYQPPRPHRLLNRLGHVHNVSHTWGRSTRTRAFARLTHGQHSPTPGRSLLQRSVSRIWQPVAPKWHRAVFGFWHFRAHARARLSRFRPEEATPPAEACLDRVSELATAFASAGAVDEHVAESLLADMRASLAARGLVDQDQLLAGAEIRHRPGRPRTGPVRTGPVRAIPVGAIRHYETEGQSGRIYLGALVLDGHEAELTVQARLSPGDDGSFADRMRPHPVHEVFDEFSATDDRGGSYYAHFGGGGGPEEWDGTLHFSPVPPSGARWLEVEVPGATPVRIDLTAAPVSYAVTSTPLAADGLAERYVDDVCIELLESVDGAELPYGAPASQTAAVAGLVLSGVLTDRSPAVRRFAAVARRLRFDLPDPLASVRPEALPTEWLALRHLWDRDDGPTGVIALAGVLPELDGAQCVVTGLRSEPDGAMLHVHARGWPEPHLRTLPLEPFTWTARDDTGGWYVTGPGGGSYSSDGRADMDLRLLPAINPAARSLDIVLTGRTGRVSVTVPLDWQEGI